jgi:hypothetical protein
MMEAWHMSNGDAKRATAKKADELRAALLRTYEEAEHARSCEFWRGRECNCFLDDIRKALVRDRRA